MAKARSVPAALDLGPNAGTDSDSSQRWDKSSRRGDALPVSPLQALLVGMPDIRALSDIKTDDDAWSLASAAHQMETQGSMVMGFALNHLRASLPPRSFSAGLAERRIPRSSAYRAIEFFDLSQRLGQIGIVPALGQLGVIKALALKEWDDGELKEFAEGRTVHGLTIDQAIDMPTREFETAVKESRQSDAERAKLRKAKDTLETKLEARDAELKRIKERALHRLNRVDLPEFAVIAREEATALTEQMDAALDGLTSLLHDNLLAPHDDVADEYTHRAAAAGTYYHSLRAIWARAQGLLQDIESHFDGKVTGFATFDHQLKPAEVDAYQHARQQIVGKLKLQAENREAKRENAKGGRGRPRTIKAEA